MIKEELSQTRQGTLSFIEALLYQKVLSFQDLNRYIKPIKDIYDPEFVRQDLETWYQNLGIESIINKSFFLSPCPFTRDEIEQAHQQQEIILCVPEGVTRQELGKLFRLDSWALHDPLIKSVVEEKDFWFKTSQNMQPHHMNMTGTQIKHLFEDEGILHFNLERYMIFIARIRYITKQTPDAQYWIWLTHVPYDRSGMLIAGFDPNGSFNVHGWMPHFSASFLGARSGFAPQK